MLLLGWVPSLPAPKCAKTRNTNKKAATHKNPSVLFVPNFWSLTNFRAGGGSFGPMCRGDFFNHKKHIKHRDLAQKDGRQDMVMLITKENG